MAAKKKTAAKKATKPATKPATKTAPKKKAAAPKKAASKKASKPADDDAKATPAPAKEKAASGNKGKFKSLDVPLPFLFTLRPRVETSFPADQFRAARQHLEDERYASLEEAARAVAAKALELTRKPGKKHGR